MTAQGCTVLKGCTVPRLQLRLLASRRSSPVVACLDQPLRRTIRQPLRRTIRVESECLLFPFKLRPVSCSPNLSRRANGGPCQHGASCWRRRRSYPTMWPRVRRAAGATIIGVPAVALGASAWYREQHRPKLPPHHLRDLNGATVVMTGATSGIGKAVASRLVSQGATVVIGCRDESRGEASRQEILSGAGISAEQVEVLPLDLANIGSVKAFARECQARHPRSISTLISVAAEIVYEHPRLTASGADLGFATNHLGLQALVSELEPSLVQASPAGSERKRVGMPRPALNRALAPVGCACGRRSRTARAVLAGTA